MKIQDITLYNFRCFDKKNISFLKGSGEVKKFTAIIGDNGVGKTTILEAIAKAFVPVLRTINQNVAGDFLDIQNTDIKSGELGTAIEISVLLDNTIYEWHNQRKLASAASIQGVVFESNSQKRIRDALATRLNNEQGESSIPLVLYYSINRMLIKLPKRVSSKSKKVKTGKPFEALDSAFSIANDYRRFFEWFKNEEDKELRSYRKNSNYISENLKPVRDVVYSMLDGYSDLRTEVSPVRMLITDDKGNDLSVTELSGGYKAIFALFSDIAIRLALANSKVANPLLSEALILIDELDLHLHPKWQKTIVNSLKNAFPNCQFIITTHSPFIIKTLSADEVYNLDKQISHSGNYYGWSIDEISEYEMFANESNGGFSDALNSFQNFIQNNDVENAIKMYKEIKNSICPSNEIEEIMKIQLIGIGVDMND